MRVLGLLHPFPSVLNALLVLGLALLAGGSPQVAGQLAVAMLALQFSIGAANDFFDVELDARTKPDKPIPAGLVSRRTAAVVAVTAGVLGLLLAAIGGAVVLALAAAMLSAGLAYDAVLKRGPWAWAAYSVAFPLLPLYAWYGASAELPPRYELVLPLAVIAGPVLQLANGIVDLEHDRDAGLETLAGRLGQRRALLLMTAALALIHGLAWLTLLGGRGAPVSALALVLAAGFLAAGGLALSAARSGSARARGWQAQALAIVLLALGWVAAVVGGPA